MSRALACSRVWRVTFEELSENLRSSGWFGRGRAGSLESFDVAQILGAAGSAFVAEEEVAADEMDGSPLNEPATYWTQARAKSTPVKR